MSETLHSASVSQPEVEISGHQPPVMPIHPVYPEPQRAGGVRRIFHAPLALIRFAVRRLLWLVVRLIRAIWRYPIVALAVVLALFLADRGYAKYIAEPPPPPPAKTFMLAPAIPPAESVLQYLRAQQSYDAQGMWNSYSATTQMDNVAQGLSLDTLRSSLQQRQAQGIRYVDSQYVGGYQLDTGDSTYFYITPIRGPGINAVIYQVFLVDDSGKISKFDQQQVQ